MAKPAFPAILASTSLTSGIVAAFPLNEGSGTSATDIVGGAVLDCSGFGVSWNASPLGLLTVGTAGSPSRAFVATPAYLKMQPPFTYMWLGQVIGSSPDGFGGTLDSATGSNTGYLLNINGGKISCATNQNGTTTGFNTATTVGNNAYNLLLAIGVGQPSPAAVNQRETVCVNGVMDAGGGTSAVTTITYAATSQFYTGSVPHFTDAVNLRTDLIVMWNRFLVASEVAALNTDPWQIFAPPATALGAALLMAM